MTHSTITAKHPAIGARHQAVSDKRFIVWFSTTQKPAERVYEGRLRLHTRDRTKARLFDENEAHVEASRFLMIAGIIAAGFEAV